MYECSVVAIDWSRHVTVHTTRTRINRVSILGAGCQDGMDAHSGYEEDRFFGCWRMETVAGGLLPLKLSADVIKVSIATCVSGAYKVGRWKAGQPATGSL